MSPCGFNSAAGFADTLEPVTDYASPLRCERSFRFGFTAVDCDAGFQACPPGFGDMNLVTAPIGRIRAPLDHALQFETTEHLIGGSPRACYFPDDVRGRQPRLCLANSRVAYCGVDSSNALSSAATADRMFSQTLRTMKVSDPTAS